MIDQEKLENIMNEMATKEPERGFVLHTGPRGAEMLNRAIELEFLKTTLNSELQVGKITLDEYISLLQLGESEDSRDRYMVVAILNAKKEKRKNKAIKATKEPTQKSTPKEYGTNLQRERSSISKYRSK